MLGAVVLWVLLGGPSVMAVTEFFVPGAPPYPHWKAGDTQKIRYRTTFTEYTIALWQQFDGAAKLGPIVYQTTNGPDSQFDWLVQSYDLDLHRSNYFFFWLFEGGASAQGNGTSQQSSGFFWINASTTTTTSLLPTSPTSPLPTSSSATSSSNSVSTVSPTTSGDAKATGDASQNDSTGGPSTGAKAGIGVGAGAAGLGLIAAVLLFAKYRSKKNRELEELRSSNYDLASGNTYKYKVPQQPPSELPGHHEVAAAELG